MLRRLLCNVLCSKENKLQYTADEDKLTSGLDDFSKSYFVKRKTIILLAVFVRIIDLIISLIAFAFTAEEMYIVWNDKAYLDKFSVMVFIVECLLLLHNIIILTISYQMYIMWHEYQKSLQYSKILMFIITLMPILIATIPIYDEISSSDSPDVIMHEKYMFNVAMFQILSNIVPVITNAQNFVAPSNILISSLKESYELKFVTAIAAIIYIPIYLVVIVTVYNLSKEYLILIIGAIYTIYLALPILQNKYIIKPIEWSFIIVGIILLIYIVTHLIKTEITAIIVLSIIGAVINSYINYILMSIIMIDIISHLVTKLRNSTVEDVDLFSILLDGALTPKGYKTLKNNA